jgi:hypothetical protein
MLNLASTGVLQVITAAASTVDCMASWVDFQSGGTGVVPSSLATAITTAATTTIVGAPASGDIRNIKSCYIRNRGAVSTTVTVRVLISAVGYEIRKVTLFPGDTLVYDEGSIAWDVLRELSGFRSISTADQSVPVALTAITNGTLDANNLKAGTVFRWRVVMSKTAAGLAAQTFEVKFGTAGTTADTSRVGTTSAFSTGTQTANADVAEVFVACVVRSVGASGIVTGKMNLAHNLAATGFAPTANVVAMQTSAAFDNTTSGLKATLCTTPGTSAAVTINQVEAERLDP